jgi:hypothetical protein
MVKGVFCRQGEQGEASVDKQITKKQNIKVILAKLPY